MESLKNASVSIQPPEHGDRPRWRCARCRWVAKLRGRGKERRLAYRFSAADPAISNADRSCRETGENRYYAALSSAHLSLARSREKERTASVFAIDGRRQRGRVTQRGGRVYPTTTFAKEEEGNGETRGRLGEKERRGTTSSSAKSRDRCHGQQRATPCRVLRGKIALEGAQSLGAFWRNDSVTLLLQTTTATESVLRLAHSGKRGRADVRNVVNVLPRVDVWKEKGGGQGDKSVQGR